MPVTSLWINKLFIKLANESENVRLTIGSCGFNPNIPDKFRAKAGNSDSQ